MLEPYEGEINEFFIDVAVKNPRVEDGSYVSYEIAIETNNISFNDDKSSVHRRYSEFVLLHKLLVKEFLAWKLPSLPKKFPFKNHFRPEFIEKRRIGLEEFVKKLVAQRIFLSSKAVHLFLQSNLTMSEIKEIIQSETISSLPSCDNRFFYERLPICDPTSALSDQFGTLSLSNHTDMDASNISASAQSSVALCTVSTQRDSNSPRVPRKVSFCDKVTVAQILVE